MTQVRTIYRIQPRAERILAAIKRQRRHAIVTLATEIKFRHEQIPNIRYFLDSTTRPLIIIRRILARSPQQL